MKFKFHFVLSLCFFLVNGDLIAQQLLPLNNEINARFSPYFYSSENSHTAIKPFFENAETKWLIKPPQTIENFSNILSNYSFISLKKDSSYLKINPVIHEIYNFNLQNSSSMQNHLGFSLKSGIKNKHAFFFQYFYANNNYSNHVNLSIDTNHVVPHYGKLSGTEQNKYQFHDINFYWSYHAGRYLNIVAGKGKNFWGDGYRSLFLSDNSNSYPYLRLNLKVWKLKYVVLYSFLKDINFPDPFFKLEKKYATSHLLSYNITPWLSIGAFESVVWHGGKSSGYRSLDINYLNPIIFFRPVEFSLNDPSPDNVLLGGFYRIRINKKIHYYGQILLDDFNFAEFKNQNGYWGNKYGVQQGFRIFELFGIENFQFLGELNMVSPFTYSHTSSLDNYGHYFQPLAHPLGANFIESLGVISYYKNRLGINGKLIIAKSGLNEKGHNFGQYIYEPYNNRTTDYGFYFLDGNETIYKIIESKLTYIINPEWFLQFEVGLKFLSMSNYTDSRKDFIVFAGFRSLINNDEIDF